METVGIEKATLVGDSSDGLIAQRVALDYPHRVGCLVLIGAPTTLVGNEAIRELGEEILALEEPVSPAFVRGFVVGMIDHRLPEFLAGAAFESLEAPARVWHDYRQGVVLAVDDTARLGEIGAPTLVL